MSPRADPKKGEPQRQRIIRGRDDFVRDHPHQLTGPRIKQRGDLACVPLASWPQQQQPLLLLREQNKGVVEMVARGDRQYVWVARETIGEGRE